MYQTKRMLSFKEKLFARRRDILLHVQGLETEWQKLAEPEIEWEEEAQKAHLTEPYNKLTARGREEIEEIDRALTKIATSGYGLCERCEKPVSLKRLEALPATRFCQRCARARSRSFSPHNAVVQ